MSKKNNNLYNPAPTGIDTLDVACTPPPRIPSVNWTSPTSKNTSSPGVTWTSTSTSASMTFNYFIKIYGLRKKEFKIGADTFLFAFSASAEEVDQLNLLIVEFNETGFIDPSKLYYWETKKNLGYSFEYYLFENNNPIEKLVYSAEMSNTIYATF